MRLRIYTQGFARLYNNFVMGFVEFLLKRSIDMGNKLTKPECANCSILQIAETILKINKDILSVKTVTEIKKIMAKDKAAFHEVKPS